MAPFLRTWVSSRRSLMADFGHSVASLLTARGLVGALQGGTGLTELPQGIDKPQLSGTLTGVPVYISVHDINGSHYPGEANVILRQGAAAIEMFRPPGQILYRGYVQPGNYFLEATADGLVSPTPRPVVIPDDGKIASAYLGNPGWPFYRFGENNIPFAPREDLVAVVFETRLPFDLEWIAATASDIAAQFDIELYEQLDPAADLPFTAANHAIWVFQHKSTDAEKRLEVILELRDEMAQRERPARVGIPVDLIPGQVKVLDNRFVIRFRPTVADIENRVAQAGSGARIIRDFFIQGSEIRLVQFQDGDFRAHLGAINTLFNQGLLVYGEPDLLAELINTSFPETDALDALYGAQENLTLQKVPEAWRLLWGLDDDHHRTLGSPDVYVATVDQGIEADHPDLNRTLTDCTNQIAVYQDFEGMANCLEQGATCTPAEGGHGMAVFGIIAARTDNKEPLTGNVAGIAPNTHQIVIKRINVDCAIYKDILEWTAGFQPLDQDTDDVGVGNETFPDDWPRTQLTRGADIINCSHVAKDEAISGLMHDTLTHLTTEGRNRLGIVIVYSAGNETECITGTSTWAAHPSTLAISNSKMPNLVDSVERLNTDSNFGIEIDLCARGQRVYSLTPGGADAYFDGTSAAAPTVAAAAALMLSVNPNLPWSEVHQILRDTAVIVDHDNLDQIGQWSTDLDPFSQWYGYGRLDVFEAVRAAAARLPQPVELAPAACPPVF